MTEQTAAAQERRTYGTGSIRQRGKGRYELRVYDRTTKTQRRETWAAPPPPPDATPRQLERHERAARREAERRLAAFVTEVAQGHAPASQRTVGQLLDDWLAFVKSRVEKGGRSMTTYHGYEVRARKIRQSALGGVPLARLTTKTIDDTYRAWGAEGMNRSGILHHHRVLRAALAQAVLWDMIPSNPALRATVDPPDSPELHVPTPEELRVLVERAQASPSPDFGPIVLFAALVGCRRGELCGLQWQDIDWEASRLSIRRVVVEVDEYIAVQDRTKTKRARRLALDPTTMALLTARYQRAMADAKTLGVALAPHCYIWATDPTGLQPRHPDSLTEAWRSLIGSLRVETGQPWPYRLHDLRHFAATELIGAGVDVRTVAGRLGHADPSVTLRVYSHVIEDRDRAAAQLLGERLALPSVVHP